MLTTKERIANTEKLTLERRKEIVLETLRGLGIPRVWQFTERERDSFIERLRLMGYHPPMFDLAVQILSNERVSV